MHKVHLIQQYGKMRMLFILYRLLTDQWHTSSLSNWIQRKCKEARIGEIARKELSKRARERERKEKRMNVQIWEFVWIHTNKRDRDFTSTLQNLWHRMRIRWLFICLYAAHTYTNWECNVKCVCMIHFECYCSVPFCSGFYSIRVRFKFIKYSYIRSVCILGVV